MTFSVGYVPSRDMFEENMAIKLAMPEFLDDTMNYLRQGVPFDPKKGWELVREKLFRRNPEHELE